jgi:hypothetical protein
MRSPTKPASHADADSLLSLISELSPEHRRELMQAALTHHFAALVQKHQQLGLEGFFNVIRADSRWSLLKDIPVADLIDAGGERHGEDAGKESPASEAAHSSAESEAPAQLALVPVEQEPGHATAPKSPAKPRKAKGDGSDILDRILDLVQRSPGLRTEEIQKQLAAPMLLIKPALARLRKTKQLRGEGIKRAMKYFVS